MTQAVYSVSALVHYIKQSLDNDMNIQSILIKGEVSDFTNHRSGHWYFTLKDAKARLSCVMFSTYASRCPMLLKEGMKVIVTASVSMYEAQGNTQLYVTKVQSDGIGDLYLKYEQLKSKLLKEGLFDRKFKKPLPLYPMSIGIISAKEGAAIQDMLTTISRRWPMCDVTFYPSLVQGANAANDLIRNLKIADQGNHDVILLARGGGALEDLWCFNDEALARTIFAMNSVVVSGVGHESDTTLVDYVSDERAPTPTAAAELVTPDISEVIAHVDMLKNQLIRNMKQRMQNMHQQFTPIRENRYLKNPLRYIETLQMQLAMHIKSFERVEHTLIQERTLLQHQAKMFAYHGDMMITAYKQNLQDHRLLFMKEHDAYIKEQKQGLLRQIELLDAFSPLQVLKRGYSIARSKQRIIRSVEDVSEHEQISITLKDGVVYGEVTAKEKQS